MVDFLETSLQPIQIQVVPLFGAQALPEPCNPLVTFIFRLAAGHVRLLGILLSGDRHYFAGGVNRSQAECIPVA